MTSGHLPRRLVVGGVSAALVAGALVVAPLVGSAAAAGCPTWTDAKGDSMWHDPAMGNADPTGLSADAQLDIVSTTFGTVGDSVVGTITTDGLTATSSDMGDEFGIDFTVAGAKLTLYSDRTVAPDPIGSVYSDAAVLGPNVSGAATAVYDVAKKTVTITAKVTEVAKAAEKAVAGQAASAISSYTTNQLPTPEGGLPLIHYDDSATTQTTTIGTDCAGSAPAPGPTGTGTTTGSPSPSPSPTSTGPATSNGLFDQPRKGCVTYKDATGDADPTGTGLDNEDALDITQVNLKSPTGAFQVYVGLVDPSSGLFPLWSGPVYSTSFTVGGKKVTLTASDTGPASATVGTAANSDIKATAKLDTKAKNIVFTVPLDGLSKAVGTTVKKGTPITGTAVETDADSQLGAFPADDAAGTKPEEKTYSYGDNTCFTPPPGIFGIDADRSGQYGDTTLVFATLSDADGGPVSGVKVTGVLTGGRAVTAKTDSDGIAALLLRLTMPAGNKVLTLTYAGDPDVGATRGTRAFTVVPERTVLRTAAIRGGVQATVVDDDRTGARSTPHPVVGRYVRFTVGSKSFLRKTNSRGLAVLTGVKKGTAVKVTFLPVKNLYLGTKTVTVRAR